MGIIRIEESERTEIEEFRRMLLSCAGVNRRKNDELKIRSTEEINDDPLDKLVCVTSGVSYLGIAIVNQLLLRGYVVRVIVDSEEDVEKLREMQISGEMIGTNTNVEAVMADLSEVVSLSEAFDGCRGIIHTAAFVDPSGVSGYSKFKVETEVKITKNVIEACIATASVKRCVLTSSLMACIWNDRRQGEACQIIDHTCWSDESICLSKKLWYALGKVRAEKAAMELAGETQLKLATICPGLIIGPESSLRNSTPTIACLKGGREIYADGLLAVVEVNNAAKAHVRVLEELKRSASGRYICFDRVIRSQAEVEKLSGETGIDFSSLNDVSVNTPPRFDLSNHKLSALTSTNLRCYNNNNNNNNNNNI